jgi:hypothetical protein
MRDLSKRDLSADLPYEGLRVGRLWLDQGLALELHPSRGAQDEGAVVRLLWREFTYRDPAGVEHRLLPHDHVALTPVFALIGTHVRTARITSVGSLELTLDNDPSLAADELEDGWEYEPLPRRG